MPISTAQNVTPATEGLPKEFNTADLQDYVNSLVDYYAIPALSLAIWHKGQLFQAASGVLNIETGVSATPESVFQAGSITKVFTASLIMQLVDQGRVELDMPVKHYLRDFQVADRDVTNKVTVRQLLNHTSGIAGDFLPDDPYTGGNPITRFVDRCCLLSQTHPLGAQHSYSNAAYTIAGRLIEVVMGVSWFVAVEEQIIRPLGLKHTLVKPAETLRFRSAIGHVPDSDNPDLWQQTPTCYPPMGSAPAGSALTMSAADLITFARAHLNQGLTGSNDRWLTAQSVAAMQQSNIALPTYSPRFATDWGLGWFLTHQQTTRIVGHDGNTFGQQSMLRLIPEKECAFAILVNAQKADVLSEIFMQLMGSLIDLPFSLPKPIKTVKNPEKLTGIYESMWNTTEVLLVDGELRAMFADKSDSVEAITLRLQPLDAYSFATYSQTGERVSTLVFSDIDKQGIPQYVYASFRLQRRRANQK